VAATKKPKKTEWQNPRMRKGAHQKHKWREKRKDPKSKEALEEKNREGIQL